VHAYRAAVALDPSSPRLHFRLGSCLLAMGDWAAARSAFRAAEARGGNQPPTLRGVPGLRLPYRERLDLNLVPKAAYAYGLFRAARTAKKLGIERIAAAELGVAGGRGLLRLEQHARDIEAMLGVGVDVVGFDTGTGLPEAADHRDLPYHFVEGSYRMDVEKLESRLDRAQLILGDATETFPAWLEDAPATIGFVSFDMDHYTPTRAILRDLAEGDEEQLLPRLPLYFDDVVGTRGQDYNDFTGELLAIAEHNAEDGSTKVAEDRHFRSLPLNFGWHHGMYVMHRFGHPDYGTYIHTSGPDALSL
jgi:hypothetical protein